MFKKEVTDDSSGMEAIVEAMFLDRQVIGGNWWKSKEVDLEQNLKTSPTVTAGRAEYMDKVLWIEVIEKHVEFLFCL